MPFQSFDPEAHRSEYRRHLPHWSQPGCTYFVTFRLADSLPAPTLRQMRDEQETWLKANGLAAQEDVGQLSVDLQREYHRFFNRGFHENLDSGYGACVLHDSRSARIVADALLFFDGQRYALGDFVVMPNHVHLLVTPFADWTPKKLLHSWKRHSSLNINRQRGVRGTLWMDESFDHAVRSERMFAYFREYILENPRKAGLREGGFLLGCGSDSGE